MTTEVTTTTPHISDIRIIMLEQMKALRSAAPDAVEAELKRSRAISELGQTMINSAKVEIDYLEVTKQDHSPFLETPNIVKNSTPPTPQLQNNPSTTNDTKPVVTRTTWVDVISKGKGKAK